jgi:hypothetical protein
LARDQAVAGGAGHPAQGGSFLRTGYVVSRYRFIEAEKVLSGISTCAA